ncbi:MAG: beta-propeller fold lactonase family protein [Candidatus Obscuribacterales bacterium]|nr:beta-propeller fold lactonase family protein [Candidatus Obscuribacterales bacterium]
MAARAAELGLFCWLLAASLLFPKHATAQIADPPSGGAPLQSLDLGSTERNRTAELPAGGTVSIQVGEENRVVTAADLVTSAELIAVQQVLTGSLQTLLIGGAGNAVGGSFHLTETLLHDLVVPANVTLLRDFGTAGTLSLAGTLSNSGNVFAFSSNQLTTTASIAASQILNQQGAVLSSVLPASFAGLQNVNSLNLNLVAVNSIVNAGVIASSGSLSLVAGNSIVNAAEGSLSSLAVLQSVGNLNLQASNIVNAGLASSTANINIAGQTLTNLLINNTEGRLEALAGALNVRDAFFADKFDVSIIGGDILSESVNVYSGAGKIDVNVGDLTGLVNLTACEAHVQANTENLRFGSVVLSGDPTFISSGNLVLPSATSGQPFIAIAGGDITVSPGFTLDTSSGTANGGRIFLAAGAEASMSGGSVIVTGRSGIGGEVNLTGITAIDSSSSAATFSGGDISLIAFSSSPGSSQGGRVIVPNTVTITTGDPGGLAAGKLLVAAEASATQAWPNSISIGSFDGISATPGTSQVELLTISPDVTPSNPLVLDAATGVIISGSVVGTGMMQSGGVSGGALVAPGSTVRIVGGGGIATGVVSAGALDLSSGTGSIGSSLTPLVTDAQLLSANTQGNVFLQDSAPLVSLSRSSGARFSLQAPAGRIHITGDLTASGTLSLTAQSGINSIESVAATIPVGASPTGIAVSPLANLVFVANTAANSVSVIDTASNAVVNTVAVGASPRGVAVSPDGSLVYVANSASDTVSVISTASGAVIKTISVPGGPAGVTFNSAGNMVFVTSTSSNTVTFIDAAIGEVVGAPVNVQAGPVAVAFNRSNSLLYVGNQTANSISVIHPETRVVTNFPLAFSPVAFGPCPCGTKIFVADGVSNLHAFSTENNSVVVTIPLPAGSQPVGIGINPTGSLAHVANAGNGTVSTVTTLTNTVSSTTTVGGAPAAFGGFASFLDNSAVAYVSNAALNSVSFIRTPTLSASNYNLLSDTGQVNVNIVSGAVQAHNTNGSVVVTSANPIVSTGGSGVAFQLATPLGIDVLGPVTARVMDLHAMNGTFTNRSTITATGALFFIASPTIVNFGTIQTVNAAASGLLALQAPSGMLSISLSPAGVLRSAAPGNAGTLALNPAGGSSMTVSGATGSLITADVIGLQGNRERHTIDIAGYQISGVIDIRRSPTRTVITNVVGDLAIGTANLTQTIGTGSSLYVAAAGNLSVQSLNADFSGVNKNDTYLFLSAGGNVTFSEGVSMIGTATADGGTLNVQASSGSISLANTATSAFNASGRNGGVVIMTARNFQVAAENSDGSSIEANGTAGKGGYVQLVSTGPAPLVIGASSGPDFISGTILANGTVGGAIRLNASAFNIAAGGLIEANGATGSGGSVGFAGAVPLNVFNDGTIRATNGADNSGVVGFDSSPSSNVIVTGSGTIHGGSFVSFGSLDPLTLFPSAGVSLPAISNFRFGGVSVQQGGPVGNLIAVALVEPVKTVSARGPVNTTAAAVTGLEVTVQSPPVPGNALVETDKIRIAFATPHSRAADSAVGRAWLLSARVVRTAVDIGRLFSGGRILVTAVEDMVVNTPLASVLLKRGDIVLINVQDGNLAVYDLHDKLSGVKVVAGAREVKLLPGNVLYLSRDQSASLSSLNQEGFPLRDILDSRDNGGGGRDMNVITAEFSLPAAMSKLGFLRSANGALVPEDRKMMWSVLKVAAALSIVNRNQGPFK